MLCDLGALYGEPLFWLFLFGTLSRGYLEDVATRHAWVRSVARQTTTGGQR